MFTNKGARAIAMRHVLNPQKQKVYLVPFLTTKEASDAPLYSTILSERSKRFFRHFELQNLSNIGHVMSDREGERQGEVEQE